ncbi:hypothetical protein [Flavobacterium sp.]|uniref:hypothetical protein n=1 Tax=Flavobacterium sp. TaxID=239 RepID=UPI004034D696
MKLNKNIFSFAGFARKSKVLQGICNITFSLKDVAGAEIFNSIPNHREKLQIIYANLRV